MSETANATLIDTSATAATTTITKTVFFKASRQTVWDFLTDKDKLGTWFHPADANLTAGADYVMGAKADDGTQKRIIWGRVLKLEAPAHLAYTFTIEPFGGAETTVTWVLEDAAGGTRLTLTHEGIAQAAGPAALDFLTGLEHGWDKHLDDLRKAAA